MEELVDNAFKFSVPGTQIIVATYHDKVALTLSVTDRGRGMSEEQIAQLGSFVQFDRDMHEQQGAGLGLAIVKMLVKHSGGDMTIDSIVGHGTTVRIRIPVVDEN